MNLARDLLNLAQGGNAGEGLRGLLGERKAEELRRLVENERSVNPPRVAVIGKAGVGKTTTINNVFAGDFHVSHSATGTVRAQVEDFQLRGGGALRVVDMPGLGEGRDEDAAFERIYRDELPKADVVLYVMEATERLLAVDQQIFSDIVVPVLREASGDHRRGRLPRLVVGLNKVDEIGPGAWDSDVNYPSPEQEASIEARASDIVGKLRTSVRDISARSIIHYSAERRYRLQELLLAIVRASGESAWKMPVEAADPWELAAPNVREYVNKTRAGRTGGE